MKKSKRIETTQVGVEVKEDMTLKEISTVLVALAALVNRANAAVDMVLGMQGLRVGEKEMTEGPFKGKTMMTFEPREKADEDGDPPADGDPGDADVGEPTDGGDSAVH